MVHHQRYWNSRNTHTAATVKGTKKNTASNEVSAVLKDKPLPVRSANVTITAKTASITTTWDNDASITNYNVYWSTTSGTGISGIKIKLPSGQNTFKHEFLDAAGTTSLAKATDYTMWSPHKIAKVKALPVLK